MVAGNSSATKRGRLEALDRRFSPLQPSPAKITFSPTSSLFTNSQDSLEGDAAYAKLCPSALNGPLSSFHGVGQTSDPSSTVNGILSNLLEANGKFRRNVGDTIETRMQDSFVLLDSRVMQGGAIDRAKERARLSVAKRSKRHLSLRQHRKAGSYDLPKDFQKYNLYQPLQEMWMDYAKGLIADCSEKSMQSRLLMADLHGATLTVVDCKNSSYLGAQGIVLRETEKTFGLITETDKFQVIPKLGSSFRFELGNMRVTLLPDSILLRGKEDGKPRKKPSLK